MRLSKRNRRKWRKHVNLLPLLGLAGLVIHELSKDDEEDKKKKKKKKHKHDQHRKAKHMNNNDRKKKGRKAGNIAFLLTFLAMAGIISGPFSLLLVIGASSLLKKVIGTMAEGLDTTTHNKGDDERRAMEEAEARLREEKARQAAEEKLRREEEEKRKVEEQRRQEAEARKIPHTGNPEADSVIEKGLDMLEQIRKVNAAIPDAALTSQMYDLEKLVTHMLKIIGDKPAKAGQIRKFLNYYLPTTLKMLGNYRMMQDRGVSASELIEARATLIRGMGMVLGACQKQIDHLFKDDMLDVSTDMDVLEQMLKRDGFVDGGLGEVKPGPSARTATSAAMDNGAPATDGRGSGDHPTIDMDKAQTYYKQ